jgi:hypothetical protein
MAIFTRIRGHKMFIAFAGCPRSVVTGETGRAANGGMVEAGRCPCCRCVAIFADIARGQVTRRWCIGLALGRWVRAIVAGEAGSLCFIMVETCWCPGNCGVT